MAAFGLLIRGIASGYLRKYEELATTGPYARTRNPLYFGSALSCRWDSSSPGIPGAGALVGVYFAIFYYAVMRNEEEDLRARYRRGL